MAIPYGLPPFVAGSMKNPPLGVIKSFQILSADWEKLWNSMCSEKIVGVLEASGELGQLCGRTERRVVVKAVVRVALKLIRRMVRMRMVGRRIRRNVWVRFLGRYVFSIVKMRRR